MSRILTLAIIILAIVACNKNRPIEPVKPYVPEPCYDSTYFDTTIYMFKTNMKWFDMDLPIGAGGSAGIHGDGWGGKFWYGCDSFEFQYRDYAPNPASIVPDSNTIYFEVVDFNGYYGRILLFYAPIRDGIAAVFGTGRSNEDKVIIYSKGIVHYPEMAIKVFQSFEYK